VNNMIMIYILPVSLCLGVILLVLALLTDEVDEVNEKVSEIFFWLSVAFLSITYILLVVYMCTH
jgi:uncharacterized protein involved in cysteine biosynthesis